MVKTIRISLFLLSIVLVSATALSWDVTASQAEAKAIKATIERYFDRRYRAHLSLQLEGLDLLIAETQEAQAFKQAESEKLAFELVHLDANDLRYVSYQYFLDYQDISIDEGEGTAVVSLNEGHDVVFESPATKDLAEPVTSRLRNLTHLIALKKENGVWKITSDQYDDYFWRFTRNTAIQNGESLSSEDRSPSEKPRVERENQGTAPLCSLSPDSSTEIYNRDGTVAYAHEWATAPRPYNPNYFDFTDYGGDCNNFISQAIHEGGGAQMVGEDTYGWYYNSVDDYAAAWTGVYYLYRFVTTLYEDFPAGPEGCAVSLNQAEAGDVIQYSWQGDNYWNHSVIIVQTEQTLPGERTHWVAGHSPDVDFYPFEYFNVEHPDMVYRFLHIERLDGLRVYFPLIED